MPPVTSVGVRLEQKRTGDARSRHCVRRPVPSLRARGAAAALLVPGLLRHDRRPWPHFTAPSVIPAMNCFAPTMNTRISGTTAISALIMSIP